MNIRPFAQSLLCSLSPFFELIIFTASHSCYANVVLDHLDPENKFIQHRLFRDSCIQTPEGVYVKDLRVVNRDLKDMVIVDNAAYSFAF
ncbi:MAG: HAD family hydrolase [bacterium]